jgi:hypothetical protein
MPENGTDEADEAGSEGEQTTRQEYVAAKYDRAGTPGDGPSDPAHGFEGVDEGFDPSTLDVGPDSSEVAKDTDGSDSETLQETLERAAAGTWASEATVQKELDLDPVDDVDWAAELADQQKSEREILLEVRDELRGLDSPTPATEAALEKALTRADGQAERKGGENPTALMTETLEALDAMDEALPGEGGEQGDGEGGPDGEAVEATLGAYVEQGGSLDDSLAEMLAWLREQAGDVEDTEARQAILAALDRAEAGAGDAGAAV